MMICFRFGNFKLILCINELEMKNKSISMEIFLSVVDVLILSCIQDSISSKDSQLFVMFSLDHWTKSLKFFVILIFDLGKIRCFK